MTPDEIAQIYQQHLTLMTEVHDVYVALAVTAFMALVFLACMFGAAAWSVRIVNKRQAGLETKFNLLIDVLLQQAKREVEARNVEVHGETVEVQQNG